jgi:hypothetical protein
LSILIDIGPAIRIAMSTIRKSKGVCALAGPIKPACKLMIVATSMLIIMANAAGRVNNPIVKRNPPRNSV